jgi:hypothetical protein
VADGSPRNGGTTEAGLPAVVYTVAYLNLPKMTRHRVQLASRFENAVSDNPVSQDQSAIARFRSELHAADNPWYIRRSRRSTELSRKEIKIGTTFSWNN